jgi:hypothetical protein
MGQQQLCESGADVVRGMITSAQATKKAAYAACFVATLR